MKTQSLEKMMDLEKGRAQELAAYAEELIREFPEITLREWIPSFRLKDRQL